MSLYIITQTLFTGSLSLYLLKRSLGKRIVSYERLLSLIFAISAVLSVIETVYVYSMDKGLTVLLAVPFLILIFTVISIVFHYVLAISSIPPPPTLIYVPLYFPPIYVALLYLSGELNPTPTMITTIFDSKILIAEFGVYTVYLKVLGFVILGFIIGLLVYDLFKGVVDKTKYLGVIFAVVSVLTCVTVIEHFYAASVYAITSYSTLTIPALLSLYKLSGFYGIRFAQQVSRGELEPTLKRMLSKVTIFHDPTVEKALQLFEKIHSLGIPGLCITRLPPHEVRSRLPGVQVIWLSEVKNESSIPPTHISRLKASIESFAKKHESSVILLDGLEYLILYNGFDETAKLLNSIVDIAGYYNATVIVPIDTKAMHDNQVRLLERFAEYERV